MKKSAVSAFWRSLRCRDRAVPKVLQPQTLNIIKPLTTTVLEKGLRNLSEGQSIFAKKNKWTLEIREQGKLCSYKERKFQSALAMMLVWRDGFSKILEVNGMVSCPI